MSCTTGAKKNQTIKAEIRDRIVSLDNNHSVVASDDVSCDSVLKKCHKAVLSQQETIKSQKEVIGKLEEVVDAQDKEVERANNMAIGSAAGGASVSFLLLLLLLL